MSRPVTPSERDAVIQSFLIGTGRRPAAVPAAFAGRKPDEAALDALAAVALERRFMRASPAGTGNLTQVLPDDPRPIMPPRTQRAMQTLLRYLRKAESQMLMPAAIDLVEGLGWRIHPFDLPALSHVLIHRKDALGPSERAYLRAMGHRVPEDDADITAEDWDTAKPGERVKLIERMRAVDPEAALCFLKDRFGAENPPQRELLLEALAVGLSADDRPFVESIGDIDRSDHVRRKARQLLYRMPVSTERMEAIRDTASAFEVKRSPFTFMRRSISLRHRGQSVVSERAAGARVTVDELAVALGLSRSDLLEMIPSGDREVICLLMAMAVATRDADAFAAIAVRNSVLGWPAFLSDAAGGAFTLPDRRMIVRSLRGFETAVHSPGECARLRTFNGGPLIRRQADEIIESRTFKEFVHSHARSAKDYERKTGWVHIETLAGLIPPSAAPAFRQSVAGYYPDVPTTVGFYMDFVETTHLDARESGIHPHYEELP